MSFRDLLTLLAVIAVVSLGLWTATLNTDAVTVRLPGVPPYEFQTSVWVVGLFAMLAGVLATLLYTVVLSSKAAFLRWRRKRFDLKSAENTELLQAGLRATVDGDQRSALASYEEILENDPEHLDAWIQGGDVARKLGDFERAVEMHMRAHGMAPDHPLVHGALAMDFEALGEYGRAVGHIEQQIAGEPKGDPEILARLRDLLTRQSRWDEALEAQDKRSKLLTDPIAKADEEAIVRGIRLEKGRVSMEQGTPESRQEALAVFAALLKESPTFVPAYLLQGRTRMADGDQDGAVEAWQSGVEATHALVLLNELVSHYFDAGDPEQALRVFRHAVDTIDGDDGRAARLGLALLYSRLEMIEEARGELEALEEEVEFSPTLTYHLAKLSARQGDADAAAEGFRRVIQASNLLDPGYVCAHCGAHHEGYLLHCAACGRWGKVELDTSGELQAVKDRGVKAPRP